MHRRSRTPTLCLGLAWRFTIHSLFPSFVLACRGVIDNGEHVVGEQRWWDEAFYLVEEEGLELGALWTMTCLSCPLRESLVDPLKPLEECNWELTAHN
jgi:hypothetical protein